MRTPAGGSDAPTPGTAADDGPNADPNEVARTIVLNALTAAPKTRAQLAEFLAKRGVDDAVAQRCLDRFEELRLIDDAEFARMWVRSRHEHRGLSRRALSLELQRKGVHRDHIDEALEIVDEESELAAAVEVARRKVRATRGLAYTTRYRRVLAAVMRKGYSGGLAAAAARDALAEESDDDQLLFESS